MTPEMWIRFKTFSIYLCPPKPETGQTISNPNSEVEMALVSGTGFQPVGFGEHLGKNLPQLPVATGQARCLSHYRRPMPTSEFGFNCFWRRAAVSRAGREQPQQPGNGG